MKIKKLVFASALSAAMLMTACGGGGSKSQDLKGEYEVLLWVSEIKGVAESFEAQIRKFEEANPGITIKETIEGVSESTAATNMLTDVESGADIYGFAQDQFARLVNGGALSKLGKAATKAISDANDAGVVAAAKAGDYLYAYPMTSDNGYFMYYDKSVISDETHVNDLEALVADCEAAGKKFSFELANSWYTISPFFGAGCVSEWETDNSGKFTNVKDTLDSDLGVIAMRGMQHIVKSDAWLNSAKAADFTADTPSAIVVSGTWDSGTAKSALGANFGVAKLPEYHVDGKAYQLGSYNGCKLLGVKPTSNVKKSAVLHKLATFLTAEEAQMDRFEKFGWGPSNKNAQQSQAVQADPILSALFAQNQFSKPQGQIPGAWWDVAKVLATDAREAAADDVSALKAALKKYHDALDEILTPRTDPDVYTVIGHIAAIEGCDWNMDLEMVEDNGVWTLKDAITLTEGDAFKVRKNNAWDEAWPANDYVVSAGEAGANKKVQFTVSTGDVAII